MAARRCSLCSRNYATGIVKCPVCGTDTWVVQEEQPEEEQPDQATSTPIGPYGSEPTGDPFEYDPVLRWRSNELRRAGMIPAQADSLALDRSVDTHWVVERLLKRGCSGDLAFLIASS